MSSFTISLTGKTSELSANFFPGINLDARYNYSCALLEFTSYQSIPNITSPDNSVTFGKQEGDVFKHYIFDLPDGCYEVVDILEKLKSFVEAKGFSFEYKINKNTLKTSIKSSAIFEFTKYRSILEILGFERVPIPPRTWKESENVIQISKVNVIRVECNIVTGAYVNGRLCHSIYEFPSSKVDVGYKLIEQPRNLVYLPIVPRRINHIQMSIVDQDGNLVDFRGETITCRIHIKRDDF